MPESEFNPDDLSNILPLYYKRLFPYEQYYKWLSYGKDDFIARREFSFTFQGDIYVRYLSFDNMNELIGTIQKKNPIKIDIGAIYNIPPKNNKRFDSFGVVERELVFDIDMTDYDEVRTCCSGASVCTKCWKLITLACKVLDAALREDFGFSQLLWVFSGRRGIHLWVCDRAARRLIQRGAVAEYLTLIRGGNMRHKKVNLPGDKLHHSVVRALRILKPHFEEICLRDQDLLGTEERVETFLQIIGPSFDKISLQTMLEAHNSVERWNLFVNNHRLMRDKGTLPKSARHLIEEIMIQFLYPRLDINVTKGLNHLLKSPFSVHPKTGRVSVPFTIQNVDKFNPLTAPSILTIADEINQWDEQVRRETGPEDISVSESAPTITVMRIKDYKKTSLYRSIVIFENFVRSLEQVEIAAVDTSSYILEKTVLE